MSLPRRVALVSRVPALRAAELARAAAVLNTQVARDFGPPWSVRAQVRAFARLEDVPPGWWPAVVMRDIRVPGAAGIHQDRDGQPFALITHAPRWTLTASHETLEMLADPGGNRLAAAPSLKRAQGVVEYLVEVCDPCEDDRYGYDLAGMRVSDFYLPGYFDAARGRGARLSHTGAITKPLQLLPGGYLSWLDRRTGRGWQARWFDGPRPELVDLGPLTLRRSWREIFDELTESPCRRRRRGRDPAARPAAPATARSTQARVRDWEERIERLTA